IASTRCFTTESFYGLEVRIYRDISDVAAAEWDSVVGPDDLLMSHRFVQACQQARIEDAEFWHLIISKNDEIIGVATLHRMFVNLELLANGLTRKLVGQLKRGWPGFLRLPVLFCGLPVSCGQPCLKISAGAHFEHACAVVVEVMEGIAATTSTQLLCFKEFDPDAIARMDFVLSRGYFRTFSLPSCSMSLTWDRSEEHTSELQS